MSFYEIFFREINLGLQIFFNSIYNIFNGAHKFKIGPKFMGSFHLTDRKEPTVWLPTVNKILKKWRFFGKEVSKEIFFSD